MRHTCQPNHPTAREQPTKSRGTGQIRTGDAARILDTYLGVRCDRYKQRRSELVDTLQAEVAFLDETLMGGSMTVVDLPPNSGHAPTLYSLTSFPQT